MCGDFHFSAAQFCFTLVPYRPITMIDFFTLLNECGGKTLTYMHLNSIIKLLVLLFSFILHSYSSVLNLIRNHMMFSLATCKNSKKQSKIHQNDDETNSRHRANQHTKYNLWFLPDKVHPLSLFIRLFIAVLIYILNRTRVE